MYKVIANVPVFTHNFHKYSGKINRAKQIVIHFVYHKNYDQFLYISQKVIKSVKFDHTITSPVQ